MASRVERPRSRSASRSEEHTSELQSQFHLVCRLLLEKKKTSVCPPGISEGHALSKNLHHHAAPRVGFRWLIRGEALLRSAPARQVNSLFFFFNDTATTEIYTLSLHDALPI